MDDAQLELNNESSKNKLVYEANKSLKDFGIIKLDIQQAKEILDLRCDFVINITWLSFVWLFILFKTYIPLF